MPSGYKIGKTQLLRYALSGAVAAFAVLLFWLSRLEWSPEMRLWRAFGDAGFIFFFFALAIGPLAKLLPPARRLIPWRREIGIWFAILALTHAVLVFDGWAKWDAMRFLGYEFILQLSRYARIEPGFGLANLIGLMALIWALVLGATSSKRAVRFLGFSSWKWLHHGAYVIFYLALAHGVYFLFIHYTMSFHREVPPDPNWFQFPFIAIGLTVFILQISAFVKTVRSQKNRIGTRP
jgi:sulfoxide reductase heme-binding subunit YedZ